MKLWSVLLFQIPIPDSLGTPKLHQFVNECFRPTTSSEEIGEKVWILRKNAAQQILKEPETEHRSTTASRRQDAGHSGFCCTQRNPCVSWTLWTHTATNTSSSQHLSGEKWKGFQQFQFFMHVAFFCNLRFDRKDIMRAYPLARGLSQILCYSVCFTLFDSMPTAAGWFSTKPKHERISIFVKLWKF